MKTTTLWTALALSAAALGVVVAMSLQSESVQAGSREDLADTRFPVVGIVRGEMARLHLTYLQNDPAAPRLAVAVQFVDRKGHVVKTERHVLEANEIASSDFGDVELESSAAIEPGPRAEFRTAVFAFLPFCPPGSDGGTGVDSPNADGGSGGGGVDGTPGTDGGSTPVDGRLLASMEVMDRKGHATAVLNPVVLSRLQVVCGGNGPGVDGR